MSGLGISGGPDVAAVYDEDYAERFFSTTQQGGYTAYKNRRLAELMSEDGNGMVVDIGGNVNAVVDEPGSLRHEFAEHSAEYVGLDLSTAYFSNEIAHRANPSLNTYAEARGVVADGAVMPFREDAIDRFLCADVIEHIPDPGRVFDGAFQALKPGGKFTVVVPTLYKLDALDLPHVDAIRRSSHVNKLLPDEWYQIAEASGFTMDHDGVKPLAIGSGLSYVLWLDGQFITPRSQIGQDGETNEASKVHKLAKKTIGIHDREIDRALPAQTDVLDALWRSLMAVDMKEFAAAYEDALYSPGTGITQRNDAIDQMLVCIADLRISDDVAEIVQRGLLGYESNPAAVFGNSSILTLEKPKEK